MIRRTARSRRAAARGAYRARIRYSVSDRPKTSARVGSGDGKSGVATRERLFEQRRAACSPCNKIHFGCGATATTGQLAVGKSALRAALSSAAKAMATGLRLTRFFPRQCSSAHCVGCRRFGSPVTLKPPRSVLAAQSVQPSCRRPVVHPAQLRTLTSTVSC